MRLIQMSDIHWAVPCFNPRKLFNKRIIGQINYLYNRQFKVDKGLVARLADHLAKETWDHLVMTGDLTTTALEEEFAEVLAMLQNHIPLTPERFSLIPGNHDRYVPEAAEGKFLERFFGQFIPEGTFPFRKSLSPEVELVGIDVTHPEGFLGANGRLDPGPMALLEKWLPELNAAKKQVILACHFPLPLPVGMKEGFRHALDNKEEVAALLRRHPVQVYLHGHIHQRWILPPSAAYPFVAVNGGCSSASNHRRAASAGYNVIEMNAGQIKVQSVGLIGSRYEVEEEFSFDASSWKG